MDLVGAANDYIRDVIRADYTSVAHAYYIDTNPAECSTYWYMVDKGRGYVLEDVHFVATENLRDEIVARNVERHGAEHIRYLGKTYEAEPFSVGYKYYTNHDRAVIESVHRRLFTRDLYVETRAQQAFHTTKDDILSHGHGISLAEWRDIYQKHLDKLDDAALKAEADMIIQSGRDVSYNVTRDEAERKIAAYYLDDIIDDSRLVTRDIEKDKWVIGLYARLLPV
jgi:hypothetical protein